MGASSPRRRAARQTRAATSRPDPFLHELGIDLTSADKQYVLLSLVSVAENPATVADRIRSVPLLLDRLLPDTDLTRRRVARLLQGMEILSRAIRVLLTIDDLDLLGEVKTALVESIHESLPDEGNTPRDWVTKLTDALSPRLERVQARLHRAVNPTIQNAINVLAHAGDLLDPKKPLPRIVLADTIDFTAFQPSPRGSRAPSSKRRGK